MTSGPSPCEEGGPTIDTVSAAAYTIPTDQPEADGTLAWDSTTMVCATVTAGGASGLGWTYAPPAAARVIDELLGPEVVGRPSFAIAGAGHRMRTAARNAGVSGVIIYALSAMDVAMWDLKARLIGIPLIDLLGRAREEVPVYGSGGFTTYTPERLDEQLHSWLAAGVAAVKIKIGEDWGGRVDRDLSRVRQVRDVVGEGVEVFVDANGGYRRKQAVRVGRALQDLGVRWFEEPVSSEDKDGLRQISMMLDLDVTAGEYAGDLHEFRRLCEVIDCLQVDATRCGGISGWMRAAALAASYDLDVSGHCAPYLHQAAAAATTNLRHVEWFHDHVRIEQRFLEGAAPVVAGALPAYGPGPGHGLALKEVDLAPYRVRG